MLLPRRAVRVLPSAPQRPARTAAAAVACSQCHLRAFCLPTGLSAPEARTLDQLVAGRHRVPRGADLFRSGDPFDSLYAIRTGVFKTCVTAGPGRDQVTGFHVSGEILGIDGVARHVHHAGAVALEDSEVCALPYERLTALARSVGALQHHLHRVLSREVVRESRAMLLLGSMRAEERLACFLLDLGERLHARGFSRCEMVLRMTRQEIGSLLGLKLETVSRTFSRLADDGVIAIRQRNLRILDLDALRRIARQPPDSP